MMPNSLEAILKKWKFPQTIIDNYQSLGIREIFNWQAECLSIKKVVDEKKNLVYSAPTSAGKTLVAELIMLKNVLDLRRKAIFILPFVSLAKEKLNHIQSILCDSYLKADGFIGSLTPTGGFGSIDIAVCTIEKANSLLNRLIDEERIFELGVIVIDELHMVNDSGRGYLLELILSKIKYLCARNENHSKIQLIGMSATLPNLRLVADWLDATLYQTDYRPISLVECYKFEDKIYDKNKEIVSNINIDSRIENDPDLLFHLVYETIVNKLGVLIFCPTKSRCETLAENIARAIYNLERNHSEKLTFLNKDKLIDCLNELKNAPAGLDAQLGKTVRYGIAFHHAGLTVEEREIVENYFKNGHLLVIICTSTLSSGINFPARRVIIRTPMFNGRPIDPMSYKQMAGRAGRKGKDSIGESILMCANINEKRIADSLLNSEIAQSASSNTQMELFGSVKRALLETIVSGVAVQTKDIIDYVKCFLSYSLVDDSSYEKYLRWLNSNQFIDIVSSNDYQQVYKPTQLGYAVVGAAMSPDEGLVIFDELQKAMQCFVLENELHIIYQITPINISDYWIHSSTSVDWNLFYNLVQNFTPDVKRVCDLVGVRQSFILKMIKGCSMSSCDQKLLRIHLRLFTSLILNDLVNEIPFSTILNKYGCQKGFLQSLQHSSSSYASMITVFCNRLGWFNLELLVNQFHSRLMFGVQRQLLDLIRISLLNSNRARLFYNAGYTTVASLAMCDLKKIEKILRSGVSFVGKKNDNDENSSKKGEIGLWHDGKGYTYWEASACILQEANNLLKNDLEQLGVRISDDKQPSNLDKTGLLSEKSIFQFNETLDSLILSQNKSKLNPIDDKKAEDKCKTDTETIEAGMEHIDLNSEDKNSPNLIDNSQSYHVSKSFFDDQYILECAEKFEQENKISPKHKTPLKAMDNILNTTIVSQDVLLACEKFESNLSAKKTKKSFNSPKKALNFSFGDQTLKNILDSSIDGKIGCVDEWSLIKQDITDSLHKVYFSGQIKINFIDELDTLVNFVNCIKPKTLVSMSMAIQEMEKSENLNDNFYQFSNLDDNLTTTFYGIFVSFDNQKLKETNFILLKKNSNFSYHLKSLIEKEDLIKIIFYSKKHFKLINKVLGLSLKSPCYDPVVANWLLTQEQLSIYQIKQKYCPSLKIQLDNSLKNKKSCFGCSKNQVDKILCIQAAFLESLIAINCFEKIKIQLQLHNVWIYYAKVESELALLSAQMELIGFGINLEQLDKIKYVLIKKKKEIEDKVFGLSGRTINLNSTEDVSYLIYNVLKLSPCDTNNLNSKLKSHSTNKSALQKLTTQHQVPGLVILWRKIQHSLTNCVFSIEKSKQYENFLDMYRIYPTIDLCTATGRMNFYNPCLQSIPRDFDINCEPSSDLTDEIMSNEGLTCEEASFFMSKLDEDRDKTPIKSDISIRGCFVACKNRVLLSADYCQLELRIIANMCQDEHLIKIFNDTRYDVFNLLASKWLNVAIEEIDDQKRQNVKKVIYGIIYGISAKTLSTFLNQDENEASKFIDSFLMTFPGLRKFIKNQVENCRLKGYVETIRKRRRLLPNISNSDPKLKSQAERQAINTIIQGSAADIVKSAMVKIDKMLRKKFNCNTNDRFDASSRGAFMVMQLHDELIYEVNHQDLSEIKPLIKECIENCMDLPVKMKTKIRVGSTWGSLELE